VARDRAPSVYVLSSTIERLAQHVPRLLCLYAMAHKPPRSPLGEFIRNQREITRLSLRQLANLTHVSNPYLSQIERGLRAFSERAQGDRGRAGYLA
jgi:hypothetical protein